MVVKSRCILMYEIKKYSWISPWKSTWRFLIFASISADFMSFPILSGFNSQISDFGVTFQWFFFPTQLAKKDLDLLDIQSLTFLDFSFFFFFNEITHLQCFPSSSKGVCWPKSERFIKIVYFISQFNIDKNTA